MQTYLSVAVREQGHSIAIALGGELDLASSRELEQAFERVWRAEPRLVVLDMASLDFIDMTGLRLLLAAQRRAEAEGRRLVLANVRQPIRRVMTLARVRDLLTILETAP